MVEVLMSTTGIKIGIKIGYEIVFNNIKWN